MMKMVRLCAVVAWVVCNPAASAVAAGLTVEQVVRELGPRLSEGSSIFGPGDDRWPAATQRYDPYKQPTIRLVVQPAAEDDVPKIVHYANGLDVPFLAMGRRHGMTTSLAEFDGVQIDMSLLDSVVINAEKQTARLQGGVYHKPLIDALWDQGYVASTGSTSCVGVMGPGLGGGRGRLEGLYGLVSDSFVSMNVVLANGTRIAVSEQSHADLFWAMKGAGHNFGIVTSLETRIYPRPVERFYYKLYTWRGDQLERAFATANKFHNNGNHDAKMVANIGIYALDPAVSEHEAVILWSFVYAGTKEEAQNHLTPFDEIEAVSTSEGSVPYPQVADVVGTGSDSWLCQYGLVHMHYSAGLRTFSVQAQREIYDLFNAKIREQPALRRSAVAMEDYSHAGVLAFHPDSSSYPWRDRGLLNFITVTYDPDPELDDFAREWARETRDIWEKGAGEEELSRSTYVNYAHGDESVESMYGYEPWRLDKLRALKRLYDPSGRFSYYNPISPPPPPPPPPSSSAPSVVGRPEEAHESSGGEIGRTRGKPDRDEL